MTTIHALTLLSTLQIPFVDAPMVETLVTWAPFAIAVLAGVGVVGLCVLAAFVVVLASLRHPTASPTR